MDSGAYGSYPRRRRYGIGRYITKKYGSKRAYTRKVNPVNQYTFKKTRVGRLTKTQLTSTKCTYADQIIIGAGLAAMVFSSGNDFLNLTTILQSSTEWVSRSTQYSYYMINGISVSYTRKWIDPIEYGVNGVSPGFTQATFFRGMPMLNTNFYPNLLSTSVGPVVEAADSSWETSPFITTKQSHYQPFPKNFTTGTNSNGLGVWNACGSIANLAGQLSVYASNAPTVSDQSLMSIFDVEINVYVSFCNNTGA